MAGQSMRDILRRINSVKNTQQITRAMEIVAATKLRRAQEQVLAARPFAEKLQEVLARLVAAQEASRAAEGGRRRRRGSDHPLLEIRPVEKVAYVLVTADRGLAGGYNANVIRLAEETLGAEEREFTTVAVGRKGRDFLRRTERPILEEHVGIGDEVTYDRTRALSNMLVTRFQKGEFDEVHLVYTMFVSAVVQRPVVTKLLPIGGLGAEGPGEQVTGERSGKAEPSSSEHDEREEGLEYVYEPSPEAVLNILLPRFVDTQVYQALLEAKAAEHAARMTAMRNATDNAEEMIRSLNLSFNRARQESITKEISEIVGGAEALAGG